jgi:sulfate adenylyltransferase
VLEIAELVISGALEVAPVPIEPPADLGPADAPDVVLEDSEGTPVAIWHRIRHRPDGTEAGTEAGTAADHGAGPRFEPVRPFSQGPVRSARLTPAQVHARLAALHPAEPGHRSEPVYRPDQPQEPGEQAETAPAVLAVPISRALSEKTVDALLARAAESGQTLLWLAVFGTGRRLDRSVPALWRAVQALAEQALVAGHPSVAVPVAVPMLGSAVVDAGQLGDLAPLGDAGLLVAVARGFGATEVVDPAVLTEPSRTELHPAFQEPAGRASGLPGLTVFFTGLSGSGKSTVAKALVERLEEQRTVSLLDGDEVRRLLSAGLTFSRADRDLNIRRIGFVAAEVGRHGGLAVCAPIAPFAQARAQVRADVEAAGGDFLLIHVSTSLAECERRDRKGLYAKARAGLIGDFTGISSPYEEPEDADLRLDTAGLEVAEAVDTVWELLSSRGYLPR